MRRRIRALGLLCAVLTGAVAMLAVGAAVDRPRGSARSRSRRRRGGSTR